MSWFAFWRRRRPTAAPAETPPPTGLFRFAGGRRHIAGVPYALPKDDAEINRLDFQHYMLRYALRGNYLASIGQPRDMLDVGSGSGRWAQEMALAFPQTNVFGLDLVAPSADANADAAGGAPDVRPPNYVFVAGNVLEGLPFADASFDFTHQRLLFAAIPRPKWPQVVAELARVTRPRGWVELIEGNVGVGAASPAEKVFTQWALKVTMMREIDLQIGPHLPTFLQQAGLTNVAVREIQDPDRQAWRTPGPDDADRRAGRDPWTARPHPGHRRHGRRHLRRDDSAMASRSGPLPLLLGDLRGHRPASRLERS